MDALVDLPEHEQFISAFSIDGDRLSLRVCADFHPGSPAKAYAITATGLSDPETVAAFLQTVADRVDYVYLAERSGALLIDTEDGQSLLLLAGSLSGQPEELNTSELRGALDRVMAWYLAGDETARVLSSRLESVRSLLEEQARRLTVKSVSHPADSVAGVLYSQQMQMIRRLLDAAEN